MLQPVVANDGFAMVEDNSQLNRVRSALDFREIVAQVYRARYWIASIFVACLAIGLIATLLITRQYEGRVLVEVRQEAEKVLGTESDRESASTKLDSDRFFDTQVDIVNSRSVTIAVAEALGLFSNDRFLETMDVSLDDADDRVLTPQEARRELVIETLQDNLTVGFTGETRILQIIFSSPDARLSARIANGYADAYIRTNLSRKSESSVYALDFLSAQLREAQSRLEKSERGALNYARQTRLVDASNAAGSRQSGSTQPQSLVTAQLVNLNDAYSEAVAERVAAEQRWLQAAATAPLTSSEVLTNQAIQEILAQRALAEADYRKELTDRGDDHPAVLQAQERVAELNRQINAIAGNIRRSIQSQYAVARSREETLRRRLETLKGKTLTEQNQGIELSILRREADTNRQQYDALLRRFNQLNAESGVQTNNLAVIDQAMVDPEPSWPNLPLNVALSVVAGLLFSGLYILAQTQLLDRVRTGNDVTNRLGLALLGALPPTPDVLGDARDPKSHVSESLNVLRTSLLMASESGAPRSAMITSIQASEGKSSTCVALAVAYARLGKKVLIIDLDLRRPNVHRLLSLSNSVGASAVLSGQAELAAAIQETEFAGVDAITGGDVPPSPTELVMGHALDAMLASVAKVYDLVLVDSAPLLSLADAVILSSRVEATLLVIEAGRNSNRAVQAGVSRLKAAGAHISGAILTKYDPGQMGYGQDNEYSYKYAYVNQREQDGD